MPDTTAEQAIGAMLLTLKDCDYTAREINAAFAKFGYFRTALATPEETAQPVQAVATMVYFKRDGSNVEDCLPVVGDPTKQVAPRLITRTEPLFAAPPATSEERRLLRAVFDHLDRNDGQAPGHCHDKPGIWDSDNGAKAGKRCEWCALWSEVRAAMSSQKGADTHD